MLALFIVKREGRGFNTQRPSYIQLIISDVFYCGESKDRDSTGPTTIVKSYSEFISSTSLSLLSLSAMVVQTRKKESLSWNDQGALERGGSPVFSLDGELCYLRVEFLKEGMETEHRFLGRQSSWEARYNYMWTSINPYS